MSAINPRPIIFPLSNPVRLSECEFHEAVEWSRGQVLFASGSPFPEEEYNGHMLYPGQGESFPSHPPSFAETLTVLATGNNMYIFPGLGLGAILARAAAVTDSMVEASSLGLANALTEDERAYDLLYPRVERIREISAQIALSVIRAAQKAVRPSYTLRAAACADGLRVLCRAWTARATYARCRTRSCSRSCRARCGTRE